MFRQRQRLDEPRLSRWASVRCHSRCCMPQMPVEAAGIGPSRLHSQSLSRVSLLVEAEPNANIDSGRLLLCCNLAALHSGYRRRSKSAFAHLKLPHLPIATRKSRMFKRTHHLNLGERCPRSCGQRLVGWRCAASNLAMTFALRSRASQACEDTEKRFNPWAVHDSAEVVKPWRASSR